MAIEKEIEWGIASNYTLALAEYQAQMEAMDAEIQQFMETGGGGGEISPPLEILEHVAPEGDLDEILES